MQSKMLFRIQATPAAKKAIESLPRRTAGRFEQLRQELRSNGCKAGGYRLLSDDRTTPSTYCCKHLDRDWRVVTTFRTERIVRIVAIGRHDGPGFYAGLSSELGISSTGQRRDAKPGCCVGNWPSIGHDPNGYRYG